MLLVIAVIISLCWSFHVTHVLPPFAGLYLRCVPRQLLLISPNASWRKHCSLTRLIWMFEVTCKMRKHIERILNLQLNLKLSSRHFNSSKFSSQSPPWDVPINPYFVKIKTPSFPWILLSHLFSFPEYKIPVLLIDPMFRGLYF